MLYHTYQQNRHAIAKGSGVNPYRNRWMSQSSFHNRLRRAGLMERRGKELGRSVLVYIRGVGLKQLSAPPNVSILEVEEATESEVLPPKSITPYVVRPGTHTHVEINGTLYDVTLIATIKPIRGFVKNGEEMKAIVTFNSAELRHQFLSTTAAERLRRELGW